MERVESFKTVGILALQGDFDAHQNALEAEGARGVVLVRDPSDLARVDGLVMPGGESTTIAKLMSRSGLDAAIQERARKRMPIYGTCAGLILLATSIEGRPDQPTLGLLDVEVARNAFGRQIESFEDTVDFRLDNAPTPVHGVFIRAPYVTRTGPGVDVLAIYRERIVGVRQGTLLGTAFHPELTGDGRIHRLFLNMVQESTEQRS